MVANLLEQELMLTSFLGIVSALHYFEVNSFIDSLNFPL